MNFNDGDIELMHEIGFIHTLMNRLDGEVHAYALFVFLARMQMCNSPSHHQLVSLNRGANERTARAININESNVESL